MNIFSEIKSKLAIFDIVSEYSTLKRSGVYFKGLCPIHQEKTPSFYVTPHKGIFYCFSCQAGGDVITFTAFMERCSPLEAARHLAQRYQIPITETFEQPTQSSEWSAQQRHAKLCGLIAQFCHEQLMAKTDVHAFNYLMQRALSTDSLIGFQIGHLPPGERTRKRLLGYLQAEGFLADDLLSIKFMLAHKQSIYSPFEDRIIFPIKDSMGRICGFGGRVFYPQDDRPKYYNSHENNYFNKGSILFGLDQAKRSMQRTGSVYITEGYMDCISMVQSNITNCVATLGTACTNEHIKLLARHITSINVVYDGDKAGLEAAVRLSELCWQHELDIYITELPLGSDPAAYLCEEKKDWSLLPCRDIFSFYVHSLEQKFGSQPSLAEKLSALRTILERIKRIEDPLKRNVILQQAATACGIPLAALQREAAASVAPLQPKQLPQRAQVKNKIEINRFAKSLFCAILEKSDILTDHDILMVMEILPLRLRILFEKLQQYKAQTTSYEFSNFFETLTPQEQQYMAQILMEYEAHEAPPIPLLLEQCRAKFWKEMVQKLQRKIMLAQRANDHIQLAMLMQEFHALKNSILHKGAL